jgi:hypothetical protein
MHYRGETSLDQAQYLINVGRKDEALWLLNGILQHDRRNVDAWRLMAQAATSPDEMRQALSTVVQLDPTDTWAREALRKLDSRTTAGRPFGGAFITARPPTLSQPPRPESPAPAAAPAPRPHRASVPTPRATRPHNPVTVIAGVVLLLAIIGSGVVVLIFLTGSNMTRSAARVGASSLPLPAETEPVVPTPQPIPSPTDENFRVMAHLDYFTYFPAWFERLDEQHAYTFDGTAGDFVVVEVSLLDDGMSPTVLLYDIYRQPMSAPLRFIAGSPPTLSLSHQLIDSGVHYVLVYNPYIAGMYQISIRSSN